MRLARSIQLSCLVIALTALTERARAAEPDAHARAAESFREGQAAYDRHEYSAAAAAFDLAATFEPRAVSRLDAADAWTRAREPVRAAEDCDRALGMPQITPAEQAYANQLLEKIKNDIATLQVEGLASTYLTIDGAEEQRLPVRKRIAPGRHAIEFRDVATSMRAQRIVELHGGDAVELRAPLEAGMGIVIQPTVPPGPLQPPRDETRAPALTWAAFGVSSAAVAVTAVFGILTINAQSDYDSSPSVSSQSAFYRDRTVTDIALSVAVAGAVTGVALWVLAPAHVRARSSRTTVPWSLSF
jgi:hypothetical protein